MARELRVISNNQKVRQPKPEWLRIRLGDPTNQNQVLQLIEGLNLHTVCQEARCPNIFECWTDRTATFMLGGDICTRHCGFCAVGKGQPGLLDKDEPRHVAEAVHHLNLAHAVITSVNRDDLPDGGAAHWAETIREVRAANPDVIVSTAYPAPAVLIAQKYGEYAMTKIPLVQAVQGVPIPAVFAKNVGNDAALTNFYYGSPLNDLTDGPKQQKWITLYKQYYPDRTPGAFMTYGLPSAMAVTIALEKVGKDLTREKFVDAMEKVDFDTGVLAGPIAFAKDRRDGHRASVFIKFDGKSHKLMPGTYFWNGKDGM